MTVHTTLRIYAIMFTKFKAVDQYRITTRDVSKKTNVHICCTSACFFHQIVNNLSVEDFQNGI